MKDETPNGNSVVSPADAPCASHGPGAAISPRASVAYSFLSAFEAGRRLWTVSLGRVRQWRSATRGRAATALFVALLTATLYLVLTPGKSRSQASRVLPETALEVARCIQPSVRGAIDHHSYTYADDIFFWSGMSAEPVIGIAAGRKATEAAATDGPMMHTTVTDHPQRIVVSLSGDMAYEYGTSDVSFTERETGKHVAFQTGYLRVWNSVGGQCKVAASVIRSIDSTWKSH